MQSPHTSSQELHTKFGWFLLTLVVVLTFEDDLQATLFSHVLRSCLVGARVREGRVYGHYFGKIVRLLLNVLLNVKRASYDFHFGHTFVPNAWFFQVISRHF